MNVRLQQQQVQQQRRPSRRAGDRGAVLLSLGWTSGSAWTRGSSRQERCGRAASARSRQTSLTFEAYVITTTTPMETMCRSRPTRSRCQRRRRRIRWRGSVAQPLHGDVFVNNGCQRRCREQASRFLHVPTTTTVHFLEARAEIQPLNLPELCRNVHMWRQKEELGLASYLCNMSG